MQVCKEGAKLTAHQAGLLRHLQIKMATSTVRLSAALLGQNDPEFHVVEAAGSEDDEDSDSDAAAAFDDGLPDSMMLPT